jgi:type III pantothenate kinase
MILCDIGNTTVDIYENGISRKVTLAKFKPEDLVGDVWYACVNTVISKSIALLSNWHDISALIDWKKYYPTMGIDRILVCEAIEEGVIVDAGSAITVDVMNNMSYQGGFIALGLKSAQEAYCELSPVLGVSFNFEVDLDRMAKNTPDAITIGFIAPLVEKISRLGLPLYLCGGDAVLLSRFLPHAVVDNELIFKGMEKLINRNKLC